MDFSTKSLLTPKGFLSTGGVVLLLVGILGYVGILGPTPDQSVFGDFWWFDNAENFAHTVLGVVALVLVNFVKDKGLHRLVTMAVGALALVVGLYNMVGEVMVLGATLQSPMDLVLHLTVGMWGLLAGMKTAK